MEENKTQPTAEESPKETQSPIEYAEAILKRMEEQNKIAEDNLKKQELILSRAMISGKSIAGETPKKAEETPAEYAKRVMAGKL